MNPPQSAVDVVEALVRRAMVNGVGDDEIEQCARSVCSIALGAVCSQCNGSGRSEGHDCHRCGGTGSVQP